jgi:hypothetical protein
MNFTLERSLLFLALATLTFVLAYLYQRNERVQKVGGVWMWPAIFTILAAQSVFRNLPKDPSMLKWLIVAFPVGAVIGIVRGLVFGLRPGEKPGEMLLRPNLISGSIFLFVLYFNEFVHVFHDSDWQLRTFGTAFLVLSAGNSIAVNVTRLFRFRSMTGS